MEYFVIDPSCSREFIDFRALHFSDVRVLGHYDTPTALPMLLSHSHGQVLEICYLERGEQTYEVNEQEYQMHGGDVFVTFPGEPHSTSGKPQTRGSLFWMLIAVAKGSTPFLDLPKADGDALLRNLLHLPQRLFAGRPLLLPLLRGLFADAASANDPLRTLRLRVGVWHFLMEVVAAAGAAPAQVLSSEISAACEFVKAHPEEVLGAPELSKRAGLSVSHFSRKFREEMGMSISDFVLSQKIEHAQQLLSHRKLTVTEVAMRLGFSSSQYFATVFKRHTGRSPSEARREC
jgi:AraC-like DNA-binding protein